MNRRSLQLKPGITTHDLARWRPRPGENFKTPEQIRKWRAMWSNPMGSTGIAWDSSPCYFSLDDPEIKLEKNRVLAYHSMLHAQGEAGGVAIENTYRITQTGCENLTPWPYEEIQILGL